MNNRDNTPKCGCALTYTKKGMQRHHILDDFGNSLSSEQFRDV